MKNFGLVLAGVLVCTLVSAKGVDKPTPESSSVALINAAGSSLYKLLYKSAKAQTVKVSLLDENGNSIYSETFKKTSGFIRPYNFTGVSEGEYTIRVEDENGMTNERVHYKVAKVETWVSVAKVNGSENKYIFRVAASKKENVSINIYDHNSNLLYSDTESVDKPFAQVYNLKGINAFSVEVVDKNGLVKKIDY